MNEQSQKFENFLIKVIQDLAELKTDNSYQRTAIQEVKDQLKEVVTIEMYNVLRQIVEAQFTNQQKINDKNDKSIKNLENRVGVLEDSENQKDAVKKSWLSVLKFGIINVTQIISVLTICLLALESVVRHFQWPH